MRCCHPECPIAVGHDDREETTIHKKPTTRDTPPTVILAPSLWPSSLPLPLRHLAYARILPLSVMLAKASIQKN